MSDWMTIRVVLTGQPGQRLEQQPGRLLLAHADHAFADLAEAIDTAFGRWDLTPLHQFEVEGRSLLGPGAAAEDEDIEDSEDVTLGEVGLRTGARFTYTFDLGEGWMHECLIDAVGVDPDDIAGEEPEVPVPYFGWGTLPDQYGRDSEDDDDSDDDRDDDDWAAAEEESWRVVDAALSGVPRPVDDEVLASAVAMLRGRLGDDDGPYAILREAAELDPDALPDDDEELWLAAAAGVVSPADDVPLDPDSVASWTALEPADWAGAVIELVRAGVGSPVAADTLAEMIARCPEVESAELTPEAEAVLVEGLTIVTRLWRSLGAVGPDEGLTLLGLWGLPESLRVAWTE